MTKDVENYRTEIERLIEENNYSIAQLSDNFGISKTTMYLILRKLNIKPPSCKNSPVLDENRIHKLKNLLEQPRTISELTKELDVSKETLYRDFARLKDLNFVVSRVGYSRPAKYKIVSV